MAGTGTSRRDVRPGDRCRLARPRRPRALLVVVAAVDLFLTVFNYDGITTLPTQFHHVLWKIVRTLGSALPERARHSALSVGAASMLPATVALWLGLEVTGFALMYSPGLARDDFALHDAGTGLGTAFYLSAGAISSLTFGDVTARAGLDRALVDLETILGLATFTLALGYVVTTFGVLRALENLHGRVRRHAEDPERPSSILACVAAVGVAARRADDGGPLPRGAARRLRDDDRPAAAELRRTGAAICSRAALAAGFEAGEDEWVRAFRRLEERARASAGLDGNASGDEYERYRDWFPFAYRKRVILDRVADTLGYESPA